MVMVIAPRNHARISLISKPYAKWSVPLVSITYNTTILDQVIRVNGPWFKITHTPVSSIPNLNRN